MALRVCWIENRGLRSPLAGLPSAWARLEPRLRGCQPLQRSFGNKGNNDLKDLKTTLKNLRGIFKSQFS